MLNSVNDITGGMQGHKSSLLEPHNAWHRFLCTGKVYDITYYFIIGDQYFWKEEKRLKNYEEHRYDVGADASNSGAESGNVVSIGEDEDEAVDSGEQEQGAAVVILTLLVLKKSIAGWRTA
ncbi:hypothetical protein BJV82DRAFT_655164 [Fennellomyces sp. T-0311]|nr:hypothetical protein BJV82DRAFT_655164 [Fennellomyces sp. T-0311]